MRGINEQVSLLLGEREQGDKPLLVVLSFPQKMGMGLFSTPQGLQGVCSDALPTGLNLFSSQTQMVLDGPLLWYQTFVLDGLISLWSLSSPMASLGHFWVQT